MKVVSEETTVHVLKASCDCGGEMLYSTIGKRDGAYPHECTDCGKEQAFPSQYPRIVYGFEEPEVLAERATARIQKGSL